MILPAKEAQLREEGGIVAKGTLLVIQGPDQGSRYQVGDEPISLGRGAKNTIRIVDFEVSRMHAGIQWDGERFLVVDQHSSNGTFVNGLAVETAVLTNGDQIQLGRTVLLFSSTPGEDEQSKVSERINLVGPLSQDDRSHIVTELGRDAGDRLVAQATVGFGGRQAAEPAVNVLYRITEEAVRPSVPIDEVLQRILNLTLQAVGADRGCMLVADSRTDRIEPRVISHREGIDVNERMPISTGIVSYVIEKGQGVRTSDARHDARFDPGQSILQSGIREAMCVPMQGRYELLGVIYVDTTTPSEPFSDSGREDRFSEELLTLLLAIGRQSALAVENNRYQDALVTAERLAAVGQTIAILSHHIKNILQGVRGGSYLIDMGLNDGNNDLVRKGWGIVERNQERIYNLVMDMLTFSKERQPKLVRARLGDTVSDVCELMQARAGEHSVSLECRIADDVPESLFDPEGIHRAVLNIVNNALDALQGTEAGRVTVSTGYDPDGELLYVDVDDNGPGIPDDELPRLFDLFESTKGGGGTGLGLAVSRKILREHGGEIAIENRPGAGCRFRLAWPLTEEENGTESIRLNDRR